MVRGYFFFGIVTKRWPGHKAKKEISRQKSLRKEEATEAAKKTPKPKNAIPKKETTPSYPSNRVCSKSVKQEQASVLYI